MAGHSKWHNIKIRKGKQDAIRGKLFTKLAREIIVAAREGGGSPDSNLKLRLCIQKAKEASMPADNIKRAVQRGTGEVEGAQYEEVTYEGYAPAGVAIMVRCLTDNRNRTVAELRNIFTKTGGNLGETGCVAWMFDAKGLITLEAGTADEETLMMATMDAGAEDIKIEEDGIEIICPVEDLANVRDALTAANLTYKDADLTMIPQNNVNIEDIDEAKKVLRLIDMLEDNDDVQTTYSNADIPEEILQQIDI